MLSVCQCRTWLALKFSLAPRPGWFEIQESSHALSSLRRLRNERVAFSCQGLVCGGVRRRNWRTWNFFSLEISRPCLSFWGVHGAVERSGQSATFPRGRYAGTNALVSAWPPRPEAAYTAHAGSSGPGSGQLVRQEDKHLCCHFVSLLDGPATQHQSFSVPPKEEGADMI